MRSITIEKNDDKQRLDRFLSKYLSRASKSYIQKLIRLKKIKCNGHRATPDQMLNTGDVLTLYVYEEELEKLERVTRSWASRIPLSIVYENEHVIIMDKSKGVLVHAASKEDYGNNLVDAMIDELIHRGEYVPRVEKSFRPSIVNRLDFNTEGLVIGVKTRYGSLALHQALKEGRVRKYYRALCTGRIDRSGTISEALHKQGMTAVRNDATGKYAVTHYTPLYATDHFSYIDVRLETGRFHQIRAHFAGMGHPLAGDRRYGQKISGLRSQMLIAYRLVFDAVPGLPQMDQMSVDSLLLPDFEKELYRVTGWTRNE